jgi:hypothetical protein
MIFTVVGRRLQPNARPWLRWAARVPPLGRPSRYASRETSLQGACAGHTRARLAVPSQPSCTAPRSGPSVARLRWAAGSDVPVSGADAGGALWRAGPVRATCLGSVYAAGGSLQLHSPLSTQRPRVGLGARVPSGQPYVAHIASALRLSDRRPGHTPPPPSPHRSSVAAR